MRSLKEFLRNTIVGGLLFLVPVALLALVLRHAMEIAGKIARPIAERFPAHEIAGVAVGTVVAAMLLLLVAFVAGLFARTSKGRKLTRFVEESFLGNLPQYRVVTSMAEGLTKVEQADGLKPVLVETDGNWQLGYSLENVQDGWLAVFIPQSPTPLSGNVLYVRADRVRPLDVGIHKAMALVKQLGAGSSDVLKNADLSPVKSG